MAEPAKRKIIPDDLDDCINFIKRHRSEIARGDFDVHLEKDWAKALEADDLTMLAENCPASRLAIATATKSAELLEVLARDRSSDVREAVADNPRAPAASLDVLATDSVPAVRMAVAGNANTPIENLERLAADSVNHVRWGVAHNEKTPASVLGLLIKDSERHVSDEAKKHPNAPRRGFFARLFKRRS